MIVIHFIYIIQNQRVKINVQLLLKIVYLEQMEKFVC